MKKFFLLFYVTIFFVGLDQITKSWIHKNYSLGESTEVIKNFFHITYVRNTGAAFGFLHDAPEPFRKAFFLIIPLIALIGIIYLMKKNDESMKIQNLSFSLIFAGALGNYIDRFKLGFVVDFLDFHFNRAYTWPAFNVADMCIVVGSLMLFVILLREDNQKKES